MQFIVYLFSHVQLYTRAIEEQRLLLESPAAYLLPVLHDSEMYRAFIVADFNEGEMVTTADFVRMRNKYVRTPLGRYANVVFAKSNRGQGLGLLKETIGELDLGATAKRLFVKTPMFVCAPLPILKGRKNESAT